MECQLITIDGNGGILLSLKQPENFQACKGTVGLLYLY